MRPVALKTETLPEPSLPAPVWRSFRYMFRSVKLQAGKSKLAQLRDMSLGSSMESTLVSMSTKWLPYMKMPLLLAWPWTST